MFGRSAALLVFAVLLTARCAWGTCTTGPPCFTTQPSSTFVYEEDQYGNAPSLELACEAEGVPSPTISWYRVPSGGEEVEVDGGLVTENGTRLVVTGITDDGAYASRAGVSYHCRASNAFGTIRSQPAIVTYAYFDGFTGPAGTKVINLETLDDVAMECDVAEAFPEPAIQWVDQDGAVVVEQTGPPQVRLLNGGRFLAFGSLTDAFNGSRYRCRVTNALGFQTNDSSVEYQLIVGDNTGVPVNLTIFKPLEDVTARVGDEEVPFSVVVAKGGSPALYAYAFGGVSVTISGAGPYATLVEPVELADDGKKVTCLVYSMLFTANLRVIDDVDVGDPPSDDLDNFVADPKSFSCQPTMGTPQPSVDWYHNGGPLPEGVVSSGFSIDIASLEPAHKGMYQCLLTNEANSVLYSWALDVREPKAPEVVTGLSPGVEVIGVEGQPLLLSATVSADPAPSLAKWFFNGTNIANTSVTQDSADPSSYTASYNITSLSASSTGYYYTTFVNRAGSVSAAPVFVSSPVAAEVFQLQLVNATCLEEGNTALLVCEGYGRPIPIYEFVKNNETIVSDERITQNGNTLEISGIQRSDKGVYSCQSYNDVGGVTQTSPSVSDSRDLQYCSVPSVSLVSSDESNTFTEGSDAVLTCTASGTPIDSIVWSVDGAPVNNSLEHIDINAVGVGQSELKFRPIQLSDVGTYKCEASNDVGQDSAEVTITVNALHTGASVVVVASIPLAFLLGALASTLD